MARNSKNFPNFNSHFQVKIKVIHTNIVVQCLLWSFISKNNHIMTNVSRSFQQISIKIHDDFLPSWTSQNCHHVRLDRSEWHYRNSIGPKILTTGYGKIHYRYKHTTRHVQAYVQVHIQHLKGHMHHVKICLPSHSVRCRWVTVTDNQSSQIFGITFIKIMVRSIIWCICQVVLPPLALALR